MPAPISIVIPTWNAAGTIGPTLACLFEGVNAGLVRELIIADGGSDDDIAELADEVGAVFITSDKGRGKQLNAGAKVAQAPWIFFVHADTVLSDDWHKAIWDHIQNQSEAGYGKLAFDDAALMARVVSSGANLRSRLFGLPYGDQTLLVSRKLLKHVGGYRDIPLMEDVAIARKLRGRLRRLDLTATTSAKRYKRQGWFKRPTKNMMLLAQFLLGAAPEKLAAKYSKNS